MPSAWPSGLDSFVTKQDSPGYRLGDPTKVYAEDLTALQDAIRALETGAVPCVNAIAKGADPTGTSDSYQAIQDALNAAAGWMPCHVPAGTYLIGGQLRIPSNTTLVMDPQCVLQRTFAGASTVLNSDPGGGNSHITIMGGRFELGPTLPSGEHVAIINATDVRIQGVYIGTTTPGAWMTWIQDVTRFLMSDCTLDNPTQPTSENDGIHLISGSDMSVVNCTVKTDDDCLAIGSTGMTNNDIHDVVVTGCTFQSDKGRAIAIYAQAAQQVYGIKVSTCAGYANNPTGAALWIGNIYDSSMTRVRDIDVENCRLTNNLATSYMIEVGSYFTRVRLDGVDCGNGSIGAWSGDGLQLIGCTALQHPASSYVVDIESVSHLEILGGRYDGLHAAATVLHLAGVTSGSIIGTTAKNPNGGICLELNNCTGLKVLGNDFSDDTGSGNWTAVYEWGTSDYNVFEANDFRGMPWPFYSGTNGGGTVHSRYRGNLGQNTQWLDVAEHGGGVDQSKDYTALLQGMFNDASVHGGVVWLAGQTYPITGGLTIPAGVLMVQGPGTILVRPGVNIAGAILTVNAPNCTLKDFTLDGNRVNQTDQGEWSAEGINIPVSGVRMHKVRVQNTLGVGVSSPGSYNVGGPTDLEFEGCELLNCGYSSRTNAGGITVAGIVGFRIVNCHFSGCNNQCISTYESSRGTVTDNLMENPAAGAFGLATGGGTTPAHTLTIADNVVDWTGTSDASNAIDIADSSNVTVEGNVCIGGAIANLGPSYQSTIIGNTLIGTGIYLGATTPESGGPTSQNVNSTISGNTVLKAPNAGIFLQGANNVSCTGNTVMDCSQAAGEAGWYAGIWLDGGFDVVITGNRCGDDQTSKTQAYGFQASDAPSGNVLVSVNDFAGNVGGAVLNQVSPANGSITVLNNMGEPFTGGSDPRPYIDAVLDYGADPTATIDSTTQIQAALNAVDASGGRVLLNGNFRVDGTLHPKQGTLIDGWSFPVAWNDIGGDSHGTRRPSRLSGNLGTGTGQTIIYGDNGVSSVTIRGLELVGNVTAGNTGISIAGFYWNVEHCFLRNFGGPAIQDRSGADACRFNHIVAQGMLVRPASRTGTFDLVGPDHWISECEISASILASDGTGNAIGLMIRGGNAHVTDCVVEFAHVGVVILGGSDGGVGISHFKGVRSEFNNQNGWQIEGGGNEFIGCVSYNNGTLTNNTYDGWVVTGGPSNRFVGCTDSWFSGPNGTRYSFTDTSPTANTNFYSGCRSVGGGQMGLINFSQPQNDRGYVDVVQDVGADPTGQYDASAAIQRACSAAAGGKVYIPGHTFKIVAGWIGIPSNTEVYGPGVLQVAAGANFTGAVLYSNGDNVTIRDVTVDGNKANQTSGNSSDGLIEVYNTGCKLINVTVKNAWNRGIYVWQGSDHLIENCYVLDNGSGNDGASSTMSSIVLLYTYRARVIGNRVLNSGGSGILHSNSQGSTISGNSIKGIYFIGIGLGTDSFDMTVTDNTIDATGQTAGCIDIGNVTGATIEGNTGYSTDGVSGTGVVNGGPSFDVTISGNEFRYMAGGIWYGGGTGDNVKERTTISNNVCSNMVDAGIQMGSVGSVIVQGNECMNCGDGTTNPDHKAGIMLYGDDSQGMCYDVQLLGNRCGDDRVILSSSGAAAPAAPSVTPTGGLGSTWGYKVVSVMHDGDTPQSAQGQTTTGAATLDASHYNTIARPTLASGALGWRVIRTQSGGTPVAVNVDISGFIPAGTASFQDTGQAGALYQKMQSYGIRIIKGGGATHDHLRTLIALNNLHGNAVAAIQDDSSAQTTLGTNITS